MAASARRVGASQAGPAQGTPRPPRRSLYSRAAARGVRAPRGERGARQAAGGSPKTVAVAGICGNAKIVSQRCSIGSPIRGGDHSFVDVGARFAGGRSGRAAELVDGALARTALVIGSLPPHGNDLDLLVREDEERDLELILSREGFAYQAAPPFPGYPLGLRVWARFRDCDAVAVDAIPAANLTLPPAEEERLFAEALPVADYRRLLRPAPHHVLLILAHDFLEPAPRALSSGRRNRVRSALDEDPAAFERARELAPTWGSAERLARLEAALDIEEPAEARSPLQRTKEFRRAWLKGRLIAFSGPDGAARSAQADGLRRALEALDIPATLVRPASGGASALVRAALPGLLRGEVVVCDGYPRGAGRHLVRLLTPRPVRSYVIDGRRRAESLCAEVALDVWRAITA
jgi:hypothetical protein